MKKGFTLLELLIVVGLISILVTIGSNLYTYSQKKARDARRASDLENIRVALENYRSNNSSGNYPATGNLNALVSGGYIPKLPVDPLSNAFVYYYSASGSDYILGAKSETGGTCQTTNDCGIASGTQACGYCLGPYGKK